MSDSDISNAPQVTMGQDVNPTTGPSNLAQATAPPMPTLAPPSGGSRLLQILGAVARVGETAMSGIPDRGRPSFVTGLGEGARAEQAAQATQQAIKFKSFDDQVRMAELHHQDQKMQNDNQAQIDAHTKAEIDNRALANEYGINYSTIANHGPTVMDHLTAQSANGGASVPPGTHISADGDNIYMPSDPDSPKTKDGQKQMYSALAPALALPSLAPGMDFVPPKWMNMLTNKVNGFTLDGKPPQHADLPGMIAAAQTQRDSMAKNGGSDAQLKTLDNMIAIYKANLDALDKHDASVADAASKRKIAEQKASADEKGAQTRETNDDKPQKPQNTDSNGNPVWVPGVSADEKKKAELSENLTFNANSVASTLMKRPDLVGAVAGRYSTVKQLAGSDDPDLVSLGTEIHNIAIASIGIHGMRSGEQVTDVENRLLNHFKNGPQGIYGGLKSLTGSVQTFIDAARPETYKTHSKNGGAVRAMVSQ